MNIYPYGSTVYGTDNLMSDRDFILVDGSVERTKKEQDSFAGVDFNFYGGLDWVKKLHNHDIDALECHFLPKEMKINEPYKYDFYLNLSQLRKSISTSSNHSWVKAKKKIIVENDHHSGLKSLFHSLRILNFGIQIATHGTIKDYSAANDYMSQIQSAYRAPREGDTWQILHDKFKPEFNRLSTEFKKLAPKICGYCDNPCNNPHCVRHKMEDE